MTRLRAQDITNGPYFSAAPHRLLADGAGAPAPSEAVSDQVGGRALRPVLRLTARLRARQRLTQDRYDVRR